MPKLRSGNDTSTVPVLKRTRKKKDVSLKDMEPDRLNNAMRSFYLVKAAEYQHQMELMKEVADTYSMLCACIAQKCPLCESPTNVTTGLYGTKKTHAVSCYICSSSSCLWAFTTPVEVISMYDHRTKKVANFFSYLRNINLAKRELSRIRDKAKKWRKKYKEVTMLQKVKKLDKQGRKFTTTKRVLRDQ